MIDAVATANPNTIVVLETGNPVAMPWRDKVRAIVQAWYPGQADAQAIAEVRTVAGTGVLPAQPTDIPAAVAAAREADVVILYIGGKGGWYGNDLTEKEGGDTADIDLPPQQVALVDAVIEVGKPTVAVVSMDARRAGLPSWTSCRRCSPRTTAGRTKERLWRTPSSASRTLAGSCRSRSRAMSASGRSTTARDGAVAIGGRRPTELGVHCDSEPGADVPRHSEARDGTAELIRGKRGRSSSMRSHGS